MAGTILRLTKTQAIVRDETFFPKRFNRKTGKIVRSKDTPTLPRCYLEMNDA